MPSTLPAAKNLSWIKRAFLHPAVAIALVVFTMLFHFMLMYFDPFGIQSFLAISMLAFSFIIPIVWGVLRTNAYRAAGLAAPSVRTDAFGMVQTLHERNGMHPYGQPYVPSRPLWREVISHGVFLLGFALATLSGAGILFYLQPLAISTYLSIGLASLALIITSVGLYVRWEDAPLPPLTPKPKPPAKPAPSKANKDLPLHQAAQAGNVETLTAVIDASFKDPKTKDLKLTNADGQTALHAGAGTDLEQTLVLKRLIKAYAKKDPTNLYAFVQQKDKSGKTAFDGLYTNALHWAAEHGFYETLTLLIKAWPKEDLAKLPPFKPKSPLNRDVRKCAALLQKVTPQLVRSLSNDDPDLALPEAPPGYFSQRSQKTTEKPVKPTIDVQKIAAQNEARREREKAKAKEKKKAKA